MTDVKLVVFDIGGVLIELAGIDTIFRWTGDRFNSEAEMHEAWICSQAVQHYERGHCSSEQFAEDVVVDLDLPVSGAEFITEFLRWPNGLHDGAAAMLEQVKEKREIACLSNTNDLHWGNQLDSDYLDSVFDYKYLSFQMGMVKPDEEIFEAMIADLGMPPSSILFMDDNQINVDAASRTGLQSHLARGVEEARVVLLQAGCLD